MLKYIIFKLKEISLFEWAIIVFSVIVLSNVVKKIDNVFILFLGTVLFLKIILPKDDDE